MGLESATYDDDLVTTNPVGATDKKQQGDDHIRLIKSTLKTTLPNASRVAAGSTFHLLAPPRAHGGDHGE